MSTILITIRKAEAHGYAQSSAPGGIVRRQCLDSLELSVTEAAKGLEEIFVTLAVNAREAMPNGGSLRIRAANITKSECEAKSELRAIAADYVLVEVADTGVGIQKGNVDRIFEPFFTTKGPGCGFGLATVYDTIKKLNGHIIVDSEVGRGAVSRIFVPRHVPTIVDQSHM
jgi:two-component system cell cycle sensor histidine kinase/response regulator CckA